MTLNEWKIALLYEARTLGHAEATTKIKAKAAESLVGEGKLVRGGTIGGKRVGDERARWYKLPDAAS